MNDVFDHDKRSDVMSKIRGQGNETTELAMLSLLRGAHITGWRRHVQLRPKPASGAESLRKTKSGRISVRPDFTFRTQRVVLFVDGCFWHGCPTHCIQPKRNAAFWTAKLKGNKNRDSAQTRALQAAGWTVVRFWEHDLASPEVILRVVSEALTTATRSKRAPAGSCPPRAG